MSHQDILSYCPLRVLPLLVLFHVKSHTLHGAYRTIGSSNPLPLAGLPPSNYHPPPSSMDGTNLPRHFSPVPVPCFGLFANTASCPVADGFVKNITISRGELPLSCPYIDLTGIRVFNHLLFP